MSYGSSAMDGSRPVRRGAQLALAFAVIAAALIVAVALISYSRANNQLRAVSLGENAGNEFLVASALMKHASDKAFDENPPVPDNIAALAKEAETEMKLDAEVMKTGKVPGRR